MTYPKRLKPPHLKQLFGTYTAAADALGISKGAVGNWPKDEPIPENHDLRIRYELKPEAFRSGAHHNGARP